MLGNHLTWKMHMVAGSDKAIHAGDPKPTKGGTLGSDNIDNPNPQPRTLNHSKQARPDNINSPGTQPRALNHSIGWVCLCVR